MLYLCISSNYKNAMPRNKGGMGYRVNPSPIKDKDGKNLLYVVPASTTKISTSQLDRACHEHTGLPVGETERVLTALLHEVAMRLADGDRVDLKLGTIAPKLGIRGEISSTEKLSAKDVYLAGFDFRPSKQLLEEVSRQISGFIKVETSKGNTALANEEHLLTALDSCFQESEVITVREFMRFAGVKRHTAQRALDHFCEGDSPLLHRTKVGRSFAYHKAT